MKYRTDSKGTKFAAVFADEFEEEWRLFAVGFWCLRKGTLQSKEKREKGREKESSCGCARGVKTEGKIEINRVMTGCNEWSCCLSVPPDLELSSRGLQREKTELMR